MVYTPSALSLENALRAEAGLPDAAPMSTRNHHRPGQSRRIYEMSWLRRDGAVESARQSAPAKPAFEAAFSAFARGTLIATSTGVVAVEDLRPGMQIVERYYGLLEIHSDSQADTRAAGQAILDKIHENERAVQAMEEVQEGGAAIPAHHAPELERAD